MTDHTTPSAGATASADLSASIRDYLTTRTDVTQPSFHATWIVSQIVAQHTAAAVEAALAEAERAIEALPCPGSPPDPLAKYAFETGKSRAISTLATLREGQR